MALDGPVECPFDPQVGDGVLELAAGTRAALQPANGLGEADCDLFAEAPGLGAGALADQLVETLGRKPGQAREVGDRDGVLNTRTHGLVVNHHSQLEVGIGGPEFKRDGPGRIWTRVSGAERSEARVQARGVGLFGTFFGTRTL